MLGGLGLFLLGIQHLTEGRKDLAGDPCCGPSRRLVPDGKNCLFAGAEAGRETLDDAMTITETAKLSGLDPEAYLADIFALINDHAVGRLDDLLPGNWTPAAPDAAQAA